MNDDERAQFLSQFVWDETAIVSDIRHLLQNDRTQAELLRISDLRAGLALRLEMADEHMREAAA